MSSVDRLTLAKGFVMDKLYLFNYVCRKVGHGKHTSVDKLPKRCPPELGPYVSTAVKELRREGLLQTWPTSYGERCCGVRDTRGYNYANIYQKHAGLPVVDYRKSHQTTTEAPSLTQEELRALKIRKRDKDSR
jgi:hypothetical protein